MKRSPPLCFVILDGFGTAPSSTDNPITTANTPTLRFFKQNFFVSLLAASGRAVGLPDGYIGNSEVGHMTLGAGRIVLQPLTIINNAIEDQTFFSHPLFDQLATSVTQSGGRVHILGLLSDAGVHAHISHFEAMLHTLAMRAIKNVFIHPFLDGRDTLPYSAPIFLTRLCESITQESLGNIGSLHGRWYAMDRDNNWERTLVSYQVLTAKRKNHAAVSWQEALDYSYKNGITDEFFVPVQLREDCCIQSSDAVIFLNFRPERIRQIASALCTPQFSHFDRLVKPPTQIITPVNYEMINSQILYPQRPLQWTLKEVLSNEGKRMFVIAETEKYAHVTYFLGGGEEKPFPGETQVLVPSLKVKRYDEAPRMQADKITDQILLHARSNSPANVYIANYANADMVAHTGNFDATVQAIECLDEQLRALFEFFVKKQSGILIVTGDHGNAEDMSISKDGIRKTAHTRNPVPLFVVAPKFINPESCKGLEDVSPLILTFFGIPLPQEMDRNQIFFV